MTSQAPARCDRGDQNSSRPAPATASSSTINGGGERTRDYVYVQDVASANVLALENEVPPAAYNVGTGVETSVASGFVALWIPHSLDAS